MATTFGVFTFVILCFTALISFNNNKRMEIEIDNKNAALKTLNIQQHDLRTKQGIRDALRVEIPQIQAETEAALKEEAELQDENRKLKAEVETKTSKIASNDREYERYRTTLLQIGDPTELVSKSKDMRIKSQELDVLIANKEDKLENLNNENTAAAELAARLKENLDIIGRGESLPTLKTKIRHIYPNWGFVTLANGYQAGVTGGSSLDIKRDGEVIGKLLVTTVERSSASASIVPDSMAPDITLRVGDEVVATPTKN